MSRLRVSILMALPAAAFLATSIMRILFSATIYISHILLLHGKTQVQRALSKNQSMQESHLISVCLL